MRRLVSNSLIILRGMVGWDCRGEEGMPIECKRKPENGFQNLL
jgi:hypothetical protein